MKAMSTTCSVEIVSESHAATISSRIGTGGSPILSLWEGGTIKFRGRSCKKGGIAVTALRANIFEYKGESLRFAFEE